MHYLSETHRLYNLREEHSRESFCLGVRHWSVKIRQEADRLEAHDFLQNLPAILKEAWKSTHIRVQLMELLARDILIGTPEENTAQVEKIRNLCISLRHVFIGSGGGLHRITVMRELYMLHEKASECLSVVWSKEPFEADPEDRFAWMDYPAHNNIPVVVHYPRDYPEVEKSKAPSLSTDELFAIRYQNIRNELLSGQREAFDAVGSMWEAKKSGLSAAGITPRLHGLIIGPSGSGKTHVVRAFAKAEKLKLYEQSAASWMPNGSRTEVTTSLKVAKFVEKYSEGIIYIDEVEKPFPMNLLTGSAWERANADELMSLLDAKVAFWEGWNEDLAKKLDQKFFIILSGAWQSAYQEAYRIHSLLGGDWSNLSIADSFLESNHLPAELLNRVSTNVIEVLSPTQEELKGMVLAVQKDLGLQEDESAAINAAKEIVEERKGVRGVEAYMLERWMKKQREKPVLMDLPITDLRTNEIHPSQLGGTEESVE